MSIYRTAILALFLFVGSFSSVHAEEIKNFKVNYNIDKSGEVIVTENISYDFESASRHGIFRNLIKKHPQGASAWYKSRYVDIEVVSVKRDSESEPFSISDSRAQLNLKIGDADKTITGLHNYEITYRLKGSLSYGPSGAEFYWNVTGNDWPTTIGTVEATITASAENILKDIGACYQGYLGDTKACDSKTISSKQAIFTTSLLQPGEGLTVAVEVDKETVAFLSTERISYLPFGFGLVFLWFLYLLREVYKYRTEFKVSRPVIAQYEPYKNYPPMYTGVLIDNSLDPKDVSAGILYLAEQGFIRIKKTTEKVFWLFDTTDYELTLLQPVAKAPNEFLQALLNLLFVSGDSSMPVTSKLSELSKNKTTNAAAIRSLNTAIKADIKEKGYFVNSKFSKRLITLGLVTAGITLPFVFMYSGLVLVVIVTIASLGLLITLAVPRSTAMSYEAKNHIEGFKLFLSVTDKERFDFHNAPEKSPELFMKFLPYAVALGVEKKWAKVFEGVTIPNPDWYNGGSFGAFSATTLTNDLGAFSNAFTASSGTSGASGGGSSGGGGGGGGGGSW